jgi:hypothetical protein
VSALWLAALSACSEEALSPVPGGPATSGAGGAGGDGSASAGGGAGGGEAPGRWDVPAPWTLEEPFACPPSIDPEDDLFTRVLEPLGLDRTVGIPKALYESAGGRIASDPTRLSFFHTLQESPATILCFAGNLAGRADLAAGSDHPIATMIANAAVQLDLAIDAGGPFPAADEGGPLKSALLAVLAGQPWDEAAFDAGIGAVPASVQRAAARVLFAAAEAAAVRDQALGVMANGANLSTLFKRGANQWLASTTPGIDPGSATYEGMFVGSAEGSAVLYRGGVRLAQGIDEAGFGAIDDPGGDFELYVATPLGGVLLRGTGDDVYDPEADPRLAEDLVLVVDTGGDDVYRIPAGATSSEHNPVSVLIDLGGDDDYGYEVVASPHDGPGLLPADAAGRYPGDQYYGTFSKSNVARQGAGVLGYGMLIDLGGGSDRYRSLRKSQGFANFGVGVLWDDGGDDQYEAENGAQGSAVVGIALLYDGGGADSYRSFGSSQGFAWMSSFGTLYDAGGDDRYEMVVDSPVLLYSPQTPGTANSSIGQGVAFGYRRDDTGEHLAGGLALLRDKAGNDRYDGAVFVQGTGYWMGMGVLADAAGDDRYNGLFYAQGAGAHFALSAFLEGGGDDHYNEDRPALSSSIGLAHDFSVTFFVEDGGDDRYAGPDRSIGAAKCHGMSFFAENGGNDVYVAAAKAIGWATDYDWAVHTCGASTTLPTYAFFADAGGVDAYQKPDPTGYGDETQWISDDPDDPMANELAGGVDASRGSTYASAYGAVHEGRKGP